MEENKAILLEVKNLKKHFPVKNGGTLYAVDDVSFAIKEGETLGLVGESGCGKSTVGNVLMRLHPATAGEVLLEGKSIVSAKGKERKKLCNRMQIVFQDPYSSLNPKKTIRQILMEPYKIHRMGTRKEMEEKLRRVCELTGIDETLLRKYPHELDGGKRQVVGITRALALEPKFIVCDEPVSALDVSIQAKIINLLIDLQKQLHLTYLFISHDLSVVRHLSSRVAVMYLGKIVETAETDDLFRNPQHPYTTALLSAVLNVDTDANKKHIVLHGDVPSPIDPKPGCRFAPRCRFAQARCLKELPELTEVSPGHFVACFYPGQPEENANQSNDFEKK